MVSQGLGISIMPELMVAPFPIHLAVCALPKPHYRDIGICVKDAEYISQSTKSFIEHTQHMVGKLVSGTTGAVPVL